VLSRAQRNGPRRFDEGLVRHWRTGDLDIPCQVASPQSLTPFLQVVSQRCTHRAGSIVPKFGWIDCMPFVKKELAVVPFGLHVRTNGDGDAIGIGLPVNQRK